MNFEKILFVDIAIATPGDGSSPVAAMQNLPTDSVENCLYILRKYPETDIQKYYTLPCFNSWKGGISKFAFVGCPQANEAFYDILPTHLKTALADAGWLNSGNKYATIYCNTINNINVAINSGASFYTENINYLRKPYGDLFNTSDSSNDARWMFYFRGDKNIISVKNCRWSAQGCDIDDETYINTTPSQKCCAYIKTEGRTNKTVFENNIVNYIPYTIHSSGYTYAAFSFTGPMLGVYITKNKCYMTQADTSSWESTSRYSNEMFYINHIDNAQAIFQMPRFVAFNYNELTIRMCDYHNLNGWFVCRYFDRLEFIGNTIRQGVHMKQYNPNELKLYLYYKTLIQIGYDSSVYAEYMIKDNYIDLPSLWCIYNAYVLYINVMCANSSGDYQRYGTNRGVGKNIIQNITVLLGEGPSIDNISSNDLNRTNNWADWAAVYIKGKQIGYNSYDYYYYAHQANIAKNITVRNPWGTALEAHSIYTECNEIRGSVKAGDATYIKIKTMTIKKARSNAIQLCDTGNGNIEIDQLLIEDTSLNEYITWNKRMIGRIIINKTNYSVTRAGYVFSSDANSYYNETMVIQKDIGDNHGFALKSANKFIESCNLKHNENTTLKMYGRYDHDRHLKLVNCGEAGLTKIHVMPGKYKVRLNMAFNGEDFYSNTITSPSDNSKNVLNPNYITVGIKTKYGELTWPDNVALDQSENNAGWNSTEVTPFYQEYYLDIYEQQDIFTTIVRFAFYSSDTTAAIYLDPKIEIINIGNIA